MKLSVVIPFFKELPLISRAVDSVLDNSKTVDEVEVFICNDGPLNESEIRAMLSPVANQVTTVLVNRHPMGPGGARNTGLDACTGDCIAFLDADDFWLHGKVEAQLAAIQAGASFVPTAYRFDTGQTVVQPPASIDKALDVFLQRGIGTSTVMITRSLVADQRFKNIRFAQDIDYWYALASNLEFRYESLSTCFVEYNTNGSTKNKWIQFKYLQKVLAINKLKLSVRFRVLTSYVVTGAYNHYLRKLAWMKNYSFSSFINRIKS
jgi:glycosyltransferase involved in cell wall biosynthesis